MKNFNLLEHVYACSDDAYPLLQHYIDSIHQHFKQEPELIRDIELGIIEQLDAMLLGRSDKQLTKVDIEFMQQKMGDFDELEPTVTADPSLVASQQFYRDYEHRIIAGVCAGIAAYFNISAWLVRFVFILMLFTPIPIVIPYLLLWYLIPPALTKSERLNMRGIPVNLNSLVNYHGYTRGKVMHLAKLGLMLIGAFALMLFSIMIAVFVF